MIKCDHTGVEPVVKSGMEGRPKRVQHQDPNSRYINGILTQVRVSVGRGEQGVASQVWPPRCGLPGVASQVWVEGSKVWPPRCG